MIMRRLAQSLKEQNWTAICIEFVLLVVGVFLGIQVANWNAARIERALEATYLSRLADDVRSDIVEIDEINRVSTQRMSALGYLLRNATGTELPTGFDSARGRIEIIAVPPYAEDDPNTIGIALFILTTLDGNRLAYDTIINNDGIGVIHDDALVRAIQSGSKLWTLTWRPLAAVGAIDSWVSRTLLRSGRWPERFPSTGGNWSG